MTDPLKCPRCPYCRLSGDMLTNVAESGVGKTVSEGPGGVPVRKRLPSELVTTDEAAAYLKVSHDEVRDLRRRKRLAYVKLGYRTIRFRQQDLDAFVERNRVTAIGEPIQASDATALQRRLR